MKRSKIFLFYLTIFLFLSDCYRSDDKNETFVSLEDIVPPNYDHLAPPIINGERVVVNVSILQMNIRSVDESEMTFTASIEMWQQWEDKRLKFPVWSNKKYQILDAQWVKKIWTPNAYFMNSVDGKLNNIITPSNFFWFTPQKNIFYCCRASVKLMCNMNLARFPHDEQKCSIKVASALLSDRSLKFQWYMESKKYDKMSSLQQFRITNVENTECQGKIGTINASCLEKTFTLKRRCGYYIIYIYVPTILIVCISMLTFWIPADSIAARTTLGVTSLLTIITKQYQASMPNVSYIIALNIWLAACMAFVFFSLLEFAAVVFLKTKKDNDIKNDSPELIPVVISRPNDINSIMKNVWPTFGKQETVLNPKIVKINSKSNGILPAAKKFLTTFNKKKIVFDYKKLDYVSRFLFPFSFFIFCIAFFQHFRFS